MITIILPVLGRPSQAQVVVDSIRDAQAVPTDIVFVCSPGDTDEIAACYKTRERVLVTDERHERGDYARKINSAAALTDTEWVFTGADDLRFERGWDTQILMYANKAGVVGTCDNSNPRTRKGAHSTHSLVARWYIDGRWPTSDDSGHVLHEGYWHNFVDDELVTVARSRRSYQPTPVVVQHLHPTRGTAPWDPTYELGSSRFKEDRLLFQRRQREWRRLPQPIRP